MRSHNHDDDFLGDETKDTILEHLESVAASHSSRKQQSKDDVLTCIMHAENSGLYNTQTPDLIENDNSDMVSEQVNKEMLHLEDIWRKSYENRRNEWKKKTSINTPNHNLSMLSNEQSTNNQATLVKDGTAFRDAFNHSMETREPSIRQGIEATDPNQEVDLNMIIDDFNLNTEQTRAFRIVAEHSLEERPEALQMYLGGSGGTGKSRVIKALHDFFERWNQSRRFCLASYTGVAAKNISGMTLHTALCLNQKFSMGTQSKTCQDLIAMWEGVDYLFIDEVSMIGCRFLLRISKALTEAKESTASFGGINIIFAGDFAQLPPVCETRLFAHIDTAKSGSKCGQDDVMGKLLWLSVKVVVILTEVMRQTGPENETFISLLNRLRHGQCTDKDYDLLNTRVLTNATVDWSDPTWMDLPIIVSDNAVKDALNARS